MALARHQVQIFCRHDVHAGGAMGGVAGQRQSLAVGKAGQADADDHSNSCAMRAMRCRAMSSLAASGQSSTPLALTRWIRLWLPPMTSPETSLAMIQSAFLDASLPLALATTS